MRSPRGSMSNSVIPKAERLARRATELEPNRAEGFVALAYANMVQRKMLAADDLFKKALALDPNQTDGLHGYSQLLAVEGRIKESLEMRLKLQALEPFVINYVADTALIYWLDKDDATAIRMLDEFRPNRTAEIAQIHAAMGKHKEAASLLREMTAANYLPGVLEGAASLLDNAPSKTAAPESLPRLGNLSFVYLHAGAPERVFEFYEAALQAGYFQPISTTWLWHESTRRCARPSASRSTFAISALRNSSVRAAGRPIAGRPVRRISPATSCRPVRFLREGALVIYKRN